VNTEPSDRQGFEAGSPEIGDPDVRMISVVVALFNEQDNVDALLTEIHDAMEASPWPWELILVDDGSTDRTLELLRAGRARHGEHVTVLELRRNFGQTAATQAGLDAASGDLIATLDGDLQNDPADILPLAHRLLREELDLLAGWRKDRKDGLFLRKVPSVLANRLIGSVTGVRLHDYGCTLKVYRAEALRGVRLYGEMHRFIPAWLAATTAPSRIAEQPVNHRPRHAGTSKYGISRTFRVILDLLSVYFFMRYRARPGHFFGAIGMVVGALGGLILAYLSWVKLVVGEDIGTRPLLLLGVLLVVLSVQFITTGVMAELIARTYFESSDSRPYVIRRVDGPHVG
jgi:glycosyltransferase involved in cell wall biosynthesis